MGRFMPLALCAWLLVLAGANAARAETSYLSGYAGAVPSAQSLQPRSYFDRAADAGLFTALENGPLATSRVDALLAGSGVTLADLLRTHLLRRYRQMVALDFAYFSRSDMDRIHIAVEHRAPSLAAAYAAHQSEFDQIFRRYPNSGVSRGDLAFVILAGISLNWDGLQLTLQHHWRAPRTVIAGDARYSFWASTETPDYSYHGMYWGSSSFPSGPYNFPDAPADFTFSSFGDPYSDPRMNFPDLLYLSRGDMRNDIAAIAARVGLTSETLAGAHIDDALGFSFAKPAAAILFDLHQGPRDAAALAGDVDARDRDRLPAILALLEATHYMRAASDGRFELTAPVLDQQDQPMLDAALHLSRTIMVQWLNRNYRPMRAEIGPLTMKRHGLTYAEAFTQIWHELFGATTRELVRAGVIADPYAAGQASPGSISLLWRASLYHFAPG